MTSLYNYIGLFLICLFATGLIAQDDYEPNDTFVTAAQISENDTLDATIDPAGDQDYYQVTLPQPGVLVLRIINVPTNIRLQIIMYDENQNQISNSDVGGAGLPVNHEVLLDAGTYLIRVYAWNGQTSPDPYRLFVNLDLNDIYEMNNEIGTATPILNNDTLQATIRAAGDNDYYTVTLDSPGVLITEVIDVPTNIRGQFVFYDVNQAQIASSDVGSAGGPVTLERLLDTGTYYIRFYAWNGQASADLYTLYVNTDVTDTNEINNTFGQATPAAVNDTLYGTIRAAGDLDYYTFSVGGTSVVNFIVRDVAPNLRMQLITYDENQQQIASSSVASGGAPVIWSNQSFDAGLYYVRVYAWNGQASGQPYTFIIEGISDINVAENNTPPERYELSQNYPNPFNPATTIRYQLPESAVVSIRVFDLLGKEVAVLVDAEKLQAGEHQAYFDASGLASGVYIYRLETANYSQSRKMLLMQ